MTDRQRGSALRSWWVALTLIPFGQFAWAAFVYAGARARRPAWLAFGALYFLANIGGWMLTEVAAGIGFTLVFASWPASIVHAVVIRPTYVERLELFEDGISAA